MQRRSVLAALVAPLASPLVLPAAAWAQRAEPPHAWIFGTWTGGQFPAVDTAGATCFGNAVVIFARDVVLRATALDTAFRQRPIETVAVTAEGLEFRFLPLAARVPPDFAFGCASGPDVLRVERRGPDEIAFPGCGEFPSPLKRCTTR